MSRFKLSIFATIAPRSGAGKRRGRSMALPRVFGGPRKGLVIRLLLNGLGQAVVAFVIAWLMRQAFTAADSTAALTAGVSLEIVGGLLLAGFTVLGLQVLERTDSERLGQDYVMKVRLQLFQRIAAAPLRSDNPPRFGLTMTRMITDLNALKNWVSIGVARMAVAGVAVTGSLAALTYFNLMAAAAAAGLVTLCIGSGLLWTSALRARVQETRRRRGELAGNLGEKMFASQSVAHFGKIQRECQRLRAQSRRLARAMVRRVRIASMLRSLPDAALPLSIATIFLLAITRELAGGELVAILMLLGMITSSLRNVAQAWDFRLSFEEAHRRLTEVLSYPRLRQAKNAVALTGDGPLSITFRNIGVADVLKRVSVTANPGERVLVTGPTGSGKSTLMALAARLLDPDCGQVLLDGQRLRDLSLASNHRVVQLVSPKMPLLRGTVASNVAYGSGAEDADSVARAADLCGLDATSSLLPQGLDSQVQEKGQNLPEGVRACITLARAIVVRPRLLLIDDPTFFVDVQAQAALRRVLAMGQATVLMTAPVDQAVFKTDRIWHLDNGQVTETIPPYQSRTVANEFGLRVLK
ncbi:MAG: ATP-binding cassette domain-containing protein [Acidiferrobacterales bacterium]